VSQPTQLDVSADDMVRTTLFRGVDMHLLMDKLRTCQRRRVPAGQALLVQGEPNHHLYIVLKGHLYVRLDSAEKLEISVAVVGDCLGEMSVIDNRPATATVIAEVDSVVLALPGELIWSMIDHTTLVSRNLLHILAGRLRLGDCVISANHDEKERYQRYATNDLLTILRNRRWFEAEAARLVRECHDTRTPLAILMFDVDHFDAIIERFGHQASDRVIESVARIAADVVGKRGAAARYGGAEFGVLLQRGTKVEAEELAARIRKGVKDMPEMVWEGSPLPPITISNSVVFLHEGVTAKQFINEADTALRVSKKRPRA
jgi:diguanylate cyclase (GGDEF)-like protein